MYEAKLVIDFFEKAKTDKNAVRILKELAFRFEQFELATILQNIEILYFSEFKK